MMTRALFVCALAFVGATQARAQQASAGLSPAQVTVGDVFHAVLLARVDPGTRVHFPDSLSLPADVERAGARAIRVDTLPGGELEMRAAYPLVAWRPGQHALPAAAIRVEASGGVRVAELVPGTITVNSVLPQDTTGIEPRPAKSVLGASRVWWFWPLIVLLALLVGIGLWLLYRRRRPPVGAGLVPALDPRTAALAALDAALAQKWHERGEMKTFYVAVSEALRHYMATAEPALGTDLTTTELMARANHGGALESALAVLRSADMVKFARSRPDTDRATSDWRAARDWIAAFPPPRPPEPEEAP